MSVVIKNLDMPRHCDECPMRRFNLAFCQVTGESTSHHPSGKPMKPGVRPSWCPLAEVSQASPVWIPVTERLPEEGRPVLLQRIRGREKRVEQGEKAEGDWWRIYGTRTKKVEAWMPIPEPYEED